MFSFDNYYIFKDVSFLGFFLFMTNNIVCVLTLEMLQSGGSKKYLLSTF